MATTIIAGERRGLKLREGPDATIRPTQARVRKSIFQRLEPWRDKQVCDLYAGIGSCGIEALSRGASSVTFVDSDPIAIALLRANTQKLGLGTVDIIASQVERYLSITAARFDVVIADPPYGKVTWDQLFPLVNLVLRGGGEFVMEMDSTADTPLDMDVRKYGKSMVAIWRKPT